MSELTLSAFQVDSIGNLRRPIRVIGAESLVSTVGVDHFDAGGLVASPVLAEPVTATNTGGVRSGGFVAVTKLTSVAVSTDMVTPNAVNAWRIVEGGGGSGVCVHAPTLALPFTPVNPFIHNHWVPA